MRRTVINCAITLGALLTAFGAAQDYPWQPQRTITIIVPWAAGGSTDTMTRVVAAELEDALGQSVVVVNQPGASGSIGTRNAFEADKDCYTFAAGAASDLGTYIVLDMLETHLEDWHLYLTVANTSVVSVNPRTPYQDFGQLMEAFKAKPGTISVATAGQSSAGHNAMELISQATGVKYRHVTYEGGNPAVIATVGGETELTTQLAVEQAEMIRGKRLRPLAAVSEEPLALEGYGAIPPITNWITGLDIPTNYFGIWMPRGVPQECVQTMDMIWEERIQDSEALQRYARELGALFTPYYGEEAEERAMGMVRNNAWVLFDAGKAPIDPSTVGIERPAGAAQ
jgi:tripartite-type tricarboxylate transporter receptor subunit TctC